MRAQLLEAGYAGEYWYEVAGFNTELSKRGCGRVSDILQMFRIITFSIDRWRFGSSSSASITTTRSKRHMASYVEFLMRDDRWTELKPQLERNDNGNSHHRVLDTYLRMLSEYRRIMDSRERGHSRMDSSSRPVRNWSRSLPNAFILRTGETTARSSAPRARQP